MLLLTHILKLIYNLSTLTITRKPLTITRNSAYFKMHILYHASYHANYHANYHSGYHVSY